MLDEVMRVVQSLDPEVSLVILTRHVVHTNSSGVEALALEQSTCFAAELQRSAVVQLRSVTQLADRLAHISEHVIDERHELGLRLGLSAIWREVTRRVPIDAPEVVALLEPTFTLEVLLHHLQPWLPDGLPEPLSELELDILQLGLSGHRLPSVRARITAAWRRFHRLRALGPDALAPDECPMRIDDRRLWRLLHKSPARLVPPPPSPSLPLRKREPAFALDAGIPRPVRETGSFEVVC